MKWTLMAVTLGFVMDLLFGDPRWLYHPVRLMGKLIAGGEKIIRSCLPKNKTGERVGGFLLAALVAGLSTAIPFFLLRWLYGVCWWLALLLETFFCYQLLAVKSLKDESMKVYEALKQGDLPGGRRAVSMIVGRDTKFLDEAGVTRAAVETVAENTSDGVIAPLFYMMFGGAALGFCYKAINTMDSMVGYQNERYQYFGTCAAKLDDLANFIPARLAALFMVLAAKLCHMDGKNAWRIFRRDRYNHKSPNSAQTEAAMAGALDIRLAGDAVYFGKLHKKPTIGDDLRPVKPVDIVKANQLLYGTAALAAFFLAAVRGAVQILVVWL